MRRQLTPMRTGHTFKRPGGSGAYGDDGPPFGLRLSNSVHRGLRHFHELLMHDVLADILAAYGAERAVSIGKRGAESTNPFTRRAAAE